MKKTIFTIALAAVFLASCGGSSTTTPAVTDSVKTVAVDTTKKVAVDTTKKVAVDTTKKAVVAPVKTVAAPTAPKTTK